MLPGVGGALASAEGCGGSVQRLTVTATSGGDKIDEIDKIKVYYTKADLENAPALKDEQALVANKAPSSSTSGGMPPAR